jgi:hypothetical protein
MPRETTGGNKYALLRATYDVAFAGLCRARRDYEAGGAAADEMRRLKRNLDVWQTVYTRARNDLAMSVLDGCGARKRRRTLHGKLIVGSPANRSMSHAAGA